MRPVSVAATAVVAFALAGRAAAFGIAPIPDDQPEASETLVQRVERAVARAEADTAQWLRERFRASVHEEITHAAYGCDEQPAACDRAVAAGTGAGAPRAVIQGVEWNDNPPFRLESGWPLLGANCFRHLIQLPNAYPECWGAIFGAGAQWSALQPADQVAYRPGALILLRSHFGDLQVLHAMATRDGEPARETRDRIFAWARFVYAVARGRIAPDAVLASARAGSGAQFFPGSGMDVRSLFTLGTEPHGGERVRDMAFGSLLHVVEDSFSAAHVEREPPVEVDGAWQPGCIRAFHSYAHQDHSEHARADTHEALWGGHTRETVVGVVRRLREARATLDWERVQPLLQAAFTLCPGHEDEPAGAGEAYRLPDPNPQTPE